MIIQRFLFPIITLALISWAICGYIIFCTPPQSDLWVLTFLTTLFVSLEITAALATNIVKCRLAPNWQNRREIFRESLTLALPPALTIPTLLLLRYLAADSLFNTGTLLLFAVSLEICIIRKTN